MSVCDLYLLSRFGQKYFRFSFCNCLAIQKVSARVANRKAKVNIWSGWLCLFSWGEEEEEIDYNWAFFHSQSIWNWRATTFRRNAESRKTVILVSSLEKLISHTTIQSYLNVLQLWFREPHWAHQQTEDVAINCFILCGKELPPCQVKIDITPLLLLFNNICMSRIRVFPDQKMLFLSVNCSLSTIIALHLFASLLCALEWCPSSRIVVFWQTTRLTSGTCNWPPVAVFKTAAACPLPYYARRSFEQPLRYDTHS